MTTVTRFSQRVRGTLRSELLAAAARQLTRGGYRGLRMADVAAAVGVSRQTVYNEFRDKEGLATAVALRRTEQFLVGIDAAMQAADDVHTAIRDGALAALRGAAADPLITAVVSGGASSIAADLLPFVAARNAEPVLRACTEQVTRHLDRLHPGPGHAVLAESVARLVISQLLLPTGPPEQAAGHIAEITAAALAGARGNQKET